MKIENQKINKHGDNWVSKLYHGIILFWSAKEFKNILKIWKAIIKTWILSFFQFYGFEILVKFSKIFFFEFINLNKSNSAMIHQNNNINICALP